MGLRSARVCCAPLIPRAGARGRRLAGVLRTLRVLVEPMGSRPIVRICKEQSPLTRALHDWGGRWACVRRACLARRPSLASALGTASRRTAGVLRTLRVLVEPMGSRPIVRICKKQSPLTRALHDWGGRWDSNPRRQESQSWTLPTELRPPLSTSAAAGDGNLGLPDRNRTCNPQLRRLVLYPVELRAETLLAVELRAETLLGLTTPHAAWCSANWGGRGERIRTSDILLPKQARYRAALHPESNPRHAAAFRRRGTIPWPPMPVNFVLEQRGRFPGKSRF